MHRHIRQLAAVTVVLLVVGIAPLAFSLPATADAPSHRTSAELRLTTSQSGFVGSDGPDSPDVPYAGAVLADVSYDESAATGAATVRSYSRHDDSNPLDNPTRAAVYDAVVAEPGLSLAALSERTEVPRSTVRYHVRILREEGMIATATVRGKHRVYPPDDDPELAASLADESTASLLDALAAHEPASVTDLAAALDRTPGTVSYHLDRLADADLVERERSGRAVHASLVPHVRDALGEGTVIGERDVSGESDATGVAD